MDKGIPVDGAMAALDTNYVSEPQTCASDNESLSKAEENLEMAER
jgi:hypothetical protein